jgi:sulfoxide reductase heme-binding subunit YedZ
MLLRAIGAVIPLDAKRLLVYLTTGLCVAAACLLAAALKPNWDLTHVLAVGSGYVSLLLVMLSLIIGPVNLLWSRHNPVNINLRRDTGIGAGVSGLIHVIFAFQIHMHGVILRYFVEPVDHGYRPLLNLFGLSNDIGALATVLLGALLLLSNELTLRWLKGPWWKFLQRFNYLLFVAILAHTVGYQYVIKRERIMIYLVVGLTLLVVAAQAGGVVLHRRHQARHRPG